MDCTKLKYLVVLVMAILIGWLGNGQTQTQSRATGGQTVLSSSSWNRLNEDFHKAREKFLKKDFNEAASEIRQGAAFLKNEVEKATGEGKQALMTSAEELENLADQVQKGALRSAKELDQAFARAHQALARHYQSKASESWAHRATSEAGQELKAAAGHLENALSWAGQRLGEGSEKAIQEAKVIGEILEKGGTQTASEVNKDINAIGREIEKAGKKIGFLESSKAPSIQVLNRGVGSANLTTAIIKVAQQNLPAVVYIEVTESREVENPFWNFQSDPFLRRYFGIPKMPRKFKEEVKGLGSGMIIDADGHILTNYHVAGGATKMKVTLADGNQYPATLVGGDPKTDLAVIRISAKEPLPHVIFEDSDKVEVGEWVVAIGAPRALEKSVTQGIISAKHRTGITNPTSYEDFLQTDAAINPGNSGGPLLDLHGNVVGVNSAIATESGGFEGIGFAIPSNMAIYVAKALMAFGKVERGWLGVTIRNFTPELAKSLHLETVKGVLVVDVVKGSPADRAGVKKDDVVIAYRGKEIANSATLRNAVAETPVGQEVKLVVLRNGKKEDLTVKIDSQEAATKILAASVKERLGAEVRLPTPEEIQKYGLTANQGVVITWLEFKGPLREADFEVGDMILAIDNQPVEGMEGFVNLVTSLKPKQKISILALDHRTGNTVTVLVVVR
jgi:serine protease Do